MPHLSTLPSQPQRVDLSSGKELTTGPVTASSITPVGPYSEKRTPATVGLWADTLSRDFAMIVLPRNPLLSRSVQPDPSQIKRKFSTRSRTIPASGTEVISTGIYDVTSARTRGHEPTVRNNVSERHQNGKFIQRFSRPRLDDNYGGELNSNSEVRTRGANYGPLLQESLEAARTAQESWLEDINIHIRQQQDAQQEILRTAREERNRIAEEQRQIAQRLHQQQLQAYQTRLEDIARQRQVEEESRRIEAEDRRRIAREWHEQAEQQLRDQELRLAARVAEEQQRQEAEEEARILQQAVEEVERQEQIAEAERQRVMEEVERQEQIAEAERRRIARQRDCTVCMDAFDMGGMVELECEHWYCRDDFQGKDVVSEFDLRQTNAA